MPLLINSVWDMNQLGVFPLPPSPFPSEWNTKSSQGNLKVEHLAGCTQFYT